MGYRGEISAQTPSEHPSGDLSVKSQPGTREWATSVEYEYYQRLQNEMHVSATPQRASCAIEAEGKRVEDASLTLWFASHDLK